MYIYRKEIRLKMKRKVVSLLLVAVIAGSLLVGCDSGSSNDENVYYNITEEAEQPKSVEGYFEENNLVVEGAGVSEPNEAREFTFLSSMVLDGKEIDVEYSCDFGIIEKVDGDTKTITAYFVGMTPNYSEEGGYEYYPAYVYGFVDRYTGICYIDDKQPTPKTTIKVGEKEYELSFNFNSEDETITLTCPSDYDGAAFFICGSNEELGKDIEKNMDKFVSISEIKYGEYDMKFFAN